MSHDKKNSLKHIAELISQLKNLEEENLRLQLQVEKITSEHDKYKNLALKYKIEYKDAAPTKRRAKNILRFKLATILYADAQGYNKLLTDMNTVQMVDNLDEIFLQLESIIIKYDIKRLRTFGDTLMCAGGIPQKNSTNPIEVVLSAIEMQYYVRELQRVYGIEGIWDIRYGIHTGSVTAMMSGSKKIRYEVRGDTVNLAARIRSCCDPGEILISENTYELVKDLFDCEYASRTAVKYKGDMDLYYVRGIKPDYSLQAKGIIPNKRFRVSFGLIQFTDLQELMLNKLEHELPTYLYYHNVKHTIDVVTQVELIGIGEGVSDEELLLLKTAALFHDSGHILSYDEHEHFSALMVREILPDYYYTEKQILLICELISSTQLPPTPKNKLEEIMCDADLDYLGRSDMIPVSNSLYRELKEMNKIGSLRAWNELQLKFISGHQYFTKTARSLREVNKQKQVERIKILMEASDDLE